MNLTTVSLSSLLPPKGNPRRTFDQGQISGLAKSILVDGVLQNLLVRTEGEDKFRVISGKRRYLALQLLKKEGEIAGDYEVPVEIRDDLEEADAMRLATVENMQREQLHPIDEAEAFAKLLQAGGTVEEIIEKTGLSASTVKRRLAVAGLCQEAKKSLRAGTITLAIAEVLTLGSREQQRAVLESLEGEEAPDVDDIREAFLGRKPVLAMAVFPRERYAGTLTTDLFADEETTYFDDVDQFFTLQKEAIEALAEEYRKTAAWVDVLHTFTAPWWQYGEVETDQPGGVVINLHPSGSVEIREGLKRHEVRETVVAATQTVRPASQAARERPEFNAVLMRYVAYQKSAAVQAALLGNPRKAKEVSVLLLLLGFRLDYGLRLSLHAALSASPDEHGDQPSYRDLDSTAGHFADRLGLTVAEGDNRKSAGIERLLSAHGAIALYETIGTLTDEELDRLLIFLPVLCFGQEDCERLDTGESLFNAVAASLGVNMRDWWVPDELFLSALRRDQVMNVARDCGAMAELQGLAERSKKDVVAQLSRHFAEASSAQEPNEQMRKAKEWLPGILQIPALKNLAAQSAEE